MPVVPMSPSAEAPVSDLAARFERMSCLHPLWRYQEHALTAFERARAAGDQHVYLTMPPGSGKTLLGLEIGRRLGRPIVALAPTTAIQGQWAAEWTGAFAPSLVGASTDAGRAVGLGVADVGALMHRTPLAIPGEIARAPVPQARGLPPALLVARPRGQVTLA